MKKILLSTLIILNACAHEKPPPRQPSSLETGELQTLERDVSFEAMVAGLNLDSPDYKFEYKKSSTSIGLYITGPEGKVGKWVPTNESADPEAQVVSYRLGRFLQMSELTVPSAYYTLRGRALAEFRQKLNRQEKGKTRLLNQARILRELSKNPYELLGALTAPVDQFEVETVVNAASNIINRQHPIATFIRADGPMPSAQKEISLTGKKTRSGIRPTNTELALAREFSQIMVLDILTGQYDRWSGGNVEAVFRESTGALRLHFIARDNGGAGMVGTAAMKRYFGIVSRFDRAQIRLVNQLVENLRGNPAEVARVLGMRSNTKSLLARANALLAHVASLEGQYGENRVYFAD